MATATADPGIKHFLSAVSPSGLFANFFLPVLFPMPLAPVPGALGPRTPPYWLLGLVGNLMFRIFNLCPPYLLRASQAVFRKKKWGGESFPQLRLPLLPAAPRPLGGLPLFQLLPSLCGQHPLTALLRGRPKQTEPHSGRKVVILTLVPWKWGRGEPAGSALGREQEAQ